MVKIQIYQFPELDTVAIGAELMPRTRHTGNHINDTQKMTLDLNATCKLGANYHSVEVRVHFSKGYRYRRIWEKIQKKGAKSQKKIMLAQDTGSP